MVMLIVLMLVMVAMVVVSMLIVVAMTVFVLVMLIMVAFFRPGDSMMQSRGMIARRSSGVSRVYVDIHQRNPVFV